MPAVEQAFGVDLTLAEQYTPYGCGENVLGPHNLGTPNGVNNLMQALLVTLHDGIDPTTGHPMGFRLGGLEAMDTFEALDRAYQMQVEHHVAALAEQAAIAYRVVGQETPLLLMLMLLDDCVGRGKPALSGGIRHLGGTLETYGNPNVADAFAAIRTCVYEEQSLDANLLMAALRESFVGHEDVRQRLLVAPKFGNDDDRVDRLAAALHTHLCEAVQRQATRVGLDS